MPHLQFICAWVQIPNVEVWLEDCGKCECKMLFAIDYQYTISDEAKNHKTSTWNLIG